jgi:chromosome partitioning protein
MKTIAINSIKGGTGKSTLAILLIKALTGADFRCLVLDTDSSNHSVSFFLSNREEANLIHDKTIFHFFMGESIRDCVKPINENLDLILGDVRLNEFRSTDSLKRLKRSLQEADYDFTIIDTSPTYDNIIGNVLTASDILVIRYSRIYSATKLCNTSLRNSPTLSLTILIPISFSISLKNL